MASNPQFVEIPGIETEGLYRYREPETPHKLQVAFLDPAKQETYEARLRAALVAGQYDRVAAELEQQLAGFEGRTARFAKACRVEDIVIDGWADLAEILEEYEGPAVTCITAGLFNAPDLVFGKGQEYEPDLLFNLYSDDEYQFLDRDNDALLAECGEDNPGWVGHEEDVEFYVTVAGLAPLNTCLIQCRHRIYDRGAPDALTDRAPGGYVEYVLACWLRTTRFLQAMAREIETLGLPEGARLIVGAFGLDADLAAVIGERTERSAPAKSNNDGLATLTITNWERGAASEEEEEQSTGSSLRQRLSEEPAPAAPATTPEPANDPAPGSSRFFNRLFSRA
ncbi:hypothetical protein [Sphingomicrobium clamense]|uniref:Uncharacterized protein n=1 Tax=Sphingomicrobium clamense TaxID=2851013 RepID=A0ABS6V3A4_9SPHN|nr:hypothetical protein [Sphingomicrobium sp. B8]MBW0144030.1 hypothetical protein [Sphingomicrobium sp. B8]